MKICQPDIILERDDDIIVFESKLTYKPRQAKHKLQKTYIPLLQQLYDKPIKGVQVCKKVYRAARSKALFFRVEEALEADLPYCILLWKPI